MRKGSCKHFCFWFLKSECVIVTPLYLEVMNLGWKELAVWHLCYGYRWVDKVLQFSATGVIYLRQPCCRWWFHSPRCQGYQCAWAPHVKPPRTSASAVMICFQDLRLHRIESSMYHLRKIKLEEYLICQNTLKGSSNEYNGDPIFWTLKNWIMWTI
jgi:hypothetical protein